MKTPIDVINDELGRLHAALGVEFTDQEWVRNQISKLTDYILQIQNWKVAAEPVYEKYQEARK